jgi:hypothetical protein
MQIFSTVTSVNCAIEYNHIIVLTVLLADVPLYPFGEKLYRMSLFNCLQYFPTYNAHLIFEGKFKESYY